MSTSYWACVDPVPRESDTQNNCSDRVSVAVRGKPDLVVHSAGGSDRNVDTGERFTFYATVENQGDGPSDSTTLRLYRSGSGELEPCTLWMALMQVRTLNSLIL